MMPRIQTAAEAADARTDPESLQAHLDARARAAASDLVATDRKSTRLHAVNLPA